MRSSVVAIALSAGLALAWPGTAAAEPLITQAEANLPPSQEVPIPMRGVSRGPGVEQVSPDPERGVPSPLPFKVRFIARNNIAIDPASVKITYLKAQLVDLTDRIKKHLTADGFEIANADVPPGTHHMRISLKDGQGRSTTAMLKLVVAPK